MDQSTNSFEREEARQEGTNRKLYLNYAQARRTGTTVFGDRGRKVARVVLAIRVREGEGDSKEEEKGGKAEERHDASMLSLPWRALFLGGRRRRRWQILREAVIGSGVGRSWCEGWLLCDAV